MDDPSGQYGVGDRRFTTIADAYNYWAQQNPDQAASGYNPFSTTGMSSSSPMPPPTTPPGTVLMKAGNSVGYYNPTTREWIDASGNTFKPAAGVKYFGTGPNGDTYTYMINR